MEQKSALYPMRPEGIEPFSQSESQLTTKQRLTILTFERLLYETKIDGEQFPHTREYIEAHGEVPRLEEVWRIKTDTATFWPRFFMTEDGRGLLADELGENVTFTDEGAVKTWLASYPWQATDKEIFEKLAGRSNDYVQQSVVKQFERRKFRSVKGIDLPEPVVICRDPEQLLAKLRGLRILRSYYKAVGQDLKPPADSAERRAQQVLVDIYAHRVNELIAELAPEAFDVGQQLVRSDNGRLRPLAREIFRYLPVSLVDKRRGKHIQMYDRFRNGANLVSQDDVNLVTVISQATAELGDNPVVEQSRRSCYFESIPTETLEAIKIKAPEFVEWAKQLLAAYGLLSSDPDESMDRNHRASDGKWQVVISDKRTALYLEPQRGMLEVPATMDRDIIKAAITLCHEIAHVVQHENKSRWLGLALTEQIGGDRYVVISEAGGIMWERAAKLWLFGLDRPVRGHYLQAVRAKLAGGSFLGCMKAYFDSSIRAEPRGKLKAKAKRAFSSTSRLFSYGGKFVEPGQLANSQPLNYLEQEVIARSLPSNQHNLLLLIGLSPQSLSQLQQAGLIRIDELINSIWVPEPKPWEILAPVLAKKLGM
ncbi:hypothetical protein HY441_00495 [Candidatus Microgenomates bacterium]|nr:hypothetical protein [Candidatus Microgenomates bacterium]